MSYTSSIVNLSSTPWSFKSQSSHPQSLTPWSEPFAEPQVELSHASSEMTKKPPASQTISNQSSLVEPLGTRNSNVIPRLSPLNDVIFTVAQASSTSLTTPAVNPSFKNPHHVYGGTLPLPPWYEEKNFCPSTGEVLEDIDLNAGNVKNGKDVTPENLYIANKGLTETHGPACEPIGTPLSEVQPRKEADNESKKSCVHIGLPHVSIQHSKRPLSLSRSTQAEKPLSLTLRKDRWTLDGNDDSDPSICKSRSDSGHRKSSSWSSTGLIDVIKAATSACTSSQPLKARRKLPQSVIARFSAGNDGEALEDASRMSLEGVDDLSYIKDAGALDRSLQRRKIMQELLASETSYIDDLKILSHVYLSLLASHSAVSITSQEDFQLIISSILQLHEDLLPSLKALVSDPSPSYLSHPPSKQPGHWRQQSFDGVKHALGIHRSHSERKSHVVLVHEPGRVAEVAHLFEGLISKIFVYEEYAANYEKILKTFTATSKAIPTWAAYERGIEALVNSLHPTYASEKYNKKGLTIEDLLIKPIQRVCRYPLIFGEFQNQCLAIDDPAAHTQIRQVTERLRETALGIDSAIDDEKVRLRIQRARHLEELLAGPKNARLPTTIRPLGHALLCGALYSAYYSSAGDVRGQYILCALFRTHFLFASYDAKTKCFVVQALLHLSEMEVVETDNRKGLQSRDVPFSWKLQFGLHEKVHEVILCAASEDECNQWRSALQSSSVEIFPAPRTQSAASDFTKVFLLLDIKPLHTVQSNRLNNPFIHQSTIVSAPSYTMPLSIKNTWALLPSGTIDSPASSEPASPLSRSNVLVAKSRIPVLSPPRAERIRLEQAMVDVWTKDVLPYPAMTSDRSGPSFLHTANSMMRKLSKASITSSPSRRSHSMNSISAVSLPQLDGIGVDDPFVDDLDIVAARYRLRFAIPDPFVTTATTQAEAMDLNENVDMNANGVDTGEENESSVSAQKVNEESTSRAVARRISFCEDVVGKSHGEKAAKRVPRGSRIGRIGEEAQTDSLVSAKGEVEPGRVEKDGKKQRKRSRSGALREGLKSWFS